MTPSPARRVSLPGDEWAHRGALHEWWYVNCHLEDGGGRRYGLVVAFFPDYTLAALVDKAAGRTVSKNVSRGGRLQSGPSGISVGAFGLASPRPGEYVLNYAVPGFKARLVLKPRKAPLLVNGSGEIREGLLGRSRYYALTDMSAEGELSFEGAAKRLRGTGWIDRQWGDWEDMGIGGWDWFSLQFSNGWEVLATQIYSPLRMKPCVRVLSAKLPDSSELHLDRFALRRLSEWRNDEGTVYGTRWELVAPGGIRTTVKADFDSQELHPGLWEGSCTARLLTPEGEYRGVGYAEQVMRSRRSLSGLLSLASAPVHYPLQRLLGRADLGVWTLLDRVGVWKLAPGR